MKALSNDIYSFTDIEEYNSYVQRKYSNPNPIIPNQEASTTFTMDNDFIILSVVVKHSNLIDGKIAIENDIFHTTDKGFILGTLNNDRSYLMERILRVVIEDGKLTMLVDSENFKSFEVGILIDPKFDERGPLTITQFLSMLG